jgi:hypothetical protein
MASPTVSNRVEMTKPRETLEHGSTGTVSRKSGKVQGWIGKAKARDYDGLMLPRDFMTFRCSAGRTRRISGKCSRRIMFFVLIFAASTLWGQGPPFQTDDPVPVDLHHYEFYIFGSAGGTPAEFDFTGPAFEFNWGAIPRVQLHAIVPIGGIFPSNNPIYLPGGTGAHAFGLTDMELGVKIAFIKESKYIPQIGPFIMFEIPTGNYDKGLGVGKVWYKVPLWAQKKIGHWLLDGGAGETIVPQTQYRNFPYGSFLLKYTFGERLELGAEIVAHGREGYATPQTESSTLVDLGGSYHFKNHPGQQFLFCYGHSVAGQTETYAYIGMYWTWGKDKNKPDAVTTGF